MAKEDWTDLNAYKRYSGAALQGKTYRERSWKMFSHAYAVDKHQPFTAPGVRALIMERIAPEFLTFEFITDDNAQHGAFLRQQREALGLPLFDD